MENIEYLEGNQGTDNGIDKVSSVFGQGIKKTIEENIYWISFEVINTMLEYGEPFSIQEIEQKILEKWWILRTSAWYTIRMYIHKLKDLWYIIFDPKIEKYKIIKAF